MYAVIWIQKTTNILAFVQDSLANQNSDSEASPQEFNLEIQTNKNIERNKINFSFQIKAWLWYKLWILFKAKGILYSM